MFAVVEIMGHRTRAGAVSDAQMGGATLLRIEHPTRVDHTGEAPLAEFYAASAIFAIRPCSQEDATKVAEWAWPEPRTTPSLSPGFAELVEGDEDEDEDWRDDECPWPPPSTTAPSARPTPTTTGRRAARAGRGTRATPSAPASATSTRR